MLGQLGMRCGDGFGFLAISTRFKFASPDQFNDYLKGCCSGIVVEVYDFSHVWPPWPFSCGSKKLPRKRWAPIARHKIRYRHFVARTFQALAFVGAFALEKGMTVSKLVIEVDTSQVDAALEKLNVLEESGKQFWKSQVAAGSVSVEELQGFTTGYAIDPLESAIDQTVRLLRDERESEAGQKGIKTVACQRIELHLNELLALQLKHLSEPVRIERSQVGDVSFTELTSGR